MANQAIALQARAPQGGGLGTAIQQGAQMVNMMTQQRAAERQAAQAQQAMEIAAAQEARAAAKAVPEFQKAEAEAGKARVAYVMDFFDASELAIANVRDPQQARAVGTRLKQLFKEPEFHEAIDETLGSLPQDPSQFEAWRQQALFLTMDAKDQLSREFERQTTGLEERIISMPKYGVGEAVEVPGSRIKAAEGLQYIKDDQGNIYAQPKLSPGSGSLSASAVGGADTVYGFGQYGAPTKPLSSLTIGEVQDFQKGTLIPATRGKIGAGPDKGTGAVGTYQITYGTLQKYAPKVLGENWRSVPFTADVQDKIARAIYDDVKGGDLRQTWAGMPSNKPGAYANVPWEQVRDKIAAVESGGGRGGAPTPVIKGSNTKANEAFNAMEQAVARYDETITAAKRLLNNPDLDTILGNIQGNIPETALSLYSQGAANALADYNTLLTTAGFQELQAMRDASPTGGALGQVAVEENKMLQKSAFSSARAQSEAKFKQAVRDYISRLERSRNRVLGAYERQFGERFMPANAPRATKTAPKTAPKTPTRLRYNPATGDFE